MNQNESNKIRTIRYNICRSIKVVTAFIVYTGFDYNNYYNNLAENYENDTTREGETAGRGGELLQGEQSIDNTGTPVAEGNEGGA